MNRRIFIFLLNEEHGAPKTAHKAIKKCIDSLVLADQIGTHCCVNVSTRNLKNQANLSV